MFASELYTELDMSHCIVVCSHLCCLFSFLSNIKELSEQFRSSNVEKTLMPSFDYSDPSSVALEDYRAWFNQYGSMVPGNLTDCDLEKEMQQVNIEGFFFAVLDCLYFVDCA